MMMTYFEAIDQFDGRINGTANVGVLYLSYNQMCELFGRAHAEGRFDKTSTEWAFSWTNDEEDSGVFTVYDWYFARDKDDEVVTKWSIGGHCSRDFFAVMDIVENRREDLYLDRSILSGEKLYV